MEEFTSVGHLRIFMNKKKMKFKFWKLRGMDIKFMMQSADDNGISIKAPRILEKYLNIPYIVFFMQKPMNSQFTSQLCN